MKKYLCFIVPIFEIFATATGFAQAGTLDDAFGNVGIVSTSMSSSNDFCTAAGLQSDGKIVLSGKSNNNIGLLRYHANGTLDMSFGDSGMVSTDLGTISDNAESMAIQPDGKIVACGKNSNDIALLRYNSDGSPDSTFGVDGLVIFDFGSQADEARDVILQENGKLILVGNTNTDPAVARFHADGIVDSSFAENGIFTFDAGSGSQNFHAVALQSNEKVVITGTANQDVLIVRLETDGSPDSSFGVDGMTILDIDNGSEDDSRAILIQADQKIVIAGTTEMNFTEDFLLMRFLNDGTPDNSFGNNGVVHLDLATGSYDYGRSLAIQSDGRLLVAGFASFGSLGSDDKFALARFNPDGSADAGFGDNGTVFTSLGPSHDVGQKVLIQPDNKILVAGHSLVADAFSYGFAAVRYLGDGAVSSDILHSESEIQIYPNPNNGKFTVSSGYLLIQKIELFTLSGKKMGVEIDNMGSAWKVDLDSLTSGIYLVKVYTNRGILSRKVAVRF